MLIYIGSYTDDTHAEGVHLAAFDSSSGSLRHLASFDAGVNPSFLALHPNGRVLYVVNETAAHEGRATGAVGAFAIDRDAGGLTRLDVQASGGAAPCHVATDHDGRSALVANYVGGSIALLPIAADGSLVPATQVVQHTGSGADPVRQATPHPHCITVDPSNRFALVTDLGTDRVLVYRLDVASGSLHHLESAGAVLGTGAGPRHLVFHPELSLVFVANELDSTVTTLSFDGESGRLTPLRSHATLPEPWTGANYPAGLHVAPSGRTLYVSNRGHDSVAVFAIDGRTGTLTLEQVIPCGGAWPRSFTLDPTGRWLVVANQRSDSVVVFARDVGSGRLTQTSHELAVSRPACVRFGAAGSQLMP